MEAEKSCDMPSESWETRKAGTIIPSESKGLRTREATGLSPRVCRFTYQELWCLRPGEDRCPSSRRKQANLFSSAFLFNFISSNDWMLPTHIREGESSYSVYCLSNANLFWKYTETPRNNVSQLCGHPTVQQSWHIKLTITTISLSLQSNFYTADWVIF